MTSALKEQELKNDVIDIREEVTEVNLKIEEISEEIQEEGDPEREEVHEEVSKVFYRILQKEFNSYEKEDYEHQHTSEERTLQLLCYQNKFSKVDDLLSKSSEIDINSQYLGFSPIHVAAQQNDLKLLQFLISRNVDVNLKNDLGDGCIHIAIRRNHAEFVKIITEIESLDIELLNKQNISPIHLCVMNKNENFNPEIFDLLISRTANPELKARIDQLTCLHRAVSLRNKPAIEKLLELEDINIETENTQGECALHVACRYLNNKECLIPFLSKKKEVLGKYLLLRTKDTEMTPLHVACRQGCIENAKYILSTLSKEEEEGEEGEEGEAEGDKELKTNVLNAEDMYKRRPLHMCIISKSENGLDLVKLLLENGADLMSTDEGNRTALQVAVDLEKIELEGFLRKLTSEYFEKNQEEIDTTKDSETLKAEDDEEEQEEEEVEGEGEKNVDWVEAIKNDMNDE